MNPHRKARRLALQALYEIDSTDHLPTLVIEQRLEQENQSDKPLAKSSEALVARLVFGVMRTREALDELIKRYAPEWPLEQMAVVDRNVLRIAIFELVASEGTPTKVAINEAVELAKQYGGDNAPRFVNGVLGTVANKKSQLVAAYQASLGSNDGGQ